MADITINGDRTVKGKLTVTRQLDLSQDPPALSIMGQLATHRYFEEIKTLEFDRMTINGVTVIQESFGSEDFDVVYTFVAEGLDILSESPLFEEEITKREAEIYGGEKSNG